MHIYRWVKGDKVPEKIQKLIEISHERGHFKLPIRTCVLYILENNAQYGWTSRHMGFRCQQKPYLDSGYGTLMLKALETELQSYEQSTIYIVGIHSAGAF